MILALEIVLLICIIFVFLAWLANSAGGAGFWSCLKGVVLGLGQWALLIGGFVGLAFLLADIIRRITA